VAAVVDVAVVDVAFVDVAFVNAAAELKAEATPVGQ
jgi:hypothetical protein